MLEKDKKGGMMKVSSQNRSSNRASLNWRSMVSMGLILCGAQILSDAALAQSTADPGSPNKVESAKVKQATKGKQATNNKANKPHVKVKPVGSAVPVRFDSIGTANSDDPVAVATAQSAARFDKVFLFKGWDVTFPSMGDSLFQDIGGWRSALASAGFGLMSFNVTEFALNMLNTPSVVPQGYPYCPRTPSQNVCAGNQVYWGQRPGYQSYTAAYLTYDLSRWGVPDGQFQIAGNIFPSSDQSQQPRNFQFSAVAWYQTLLDKRIELKLGYFSGDPEFMGFFVGGNFSNTFLITHESPPI